MQKNSAPSTTPPRRERVVSKKLAELVNRAIDPLVAKQGFSEAALLTQWDAIVGKRVGALCQPVRLNWPPRPRGAAQAGGHARNAAAKGSANAEQAATLVLRVEPGFGLDIQHSGNAIIERVNTHLGWRCVARLSFRQETMPRPVAASNQAPAPDPAAREQASKETEGFGDEALREALIRLGERVYSGKSQK